MKANLLVLSQQSFYILGLCSDKVIRRGVFTSVGDLGNKLRCYILAYSQSAKPFRWAYTDPTRRIRVNHITGTA